MGRHGCRCRDQNRSYCRLPGFLSMDQEANAYTCSNHEKDKVHMSTRIRLTAGVAGFAEDKDYARSLRHEKILPALKRGDAIILDFSRVKYATQSFVHALIGEALKRYGDIA